MKQKTHHALLAMLVSSILLFSSASSVLILPQSARAEDPFVFKGKGFGHGVGMSQCGAKGYASQGWTCDRILKRYYTGISLSSFQTGDKTIRVLLINGQSSVTIAVLGTYRVIDEASGATVINASANDSVKVTRLSNGRFDLSWTTGGGTIAVGNYAGPLRIDPGTLGVGPLARLDGKRYYGQLRIMADGAALKVVNVLYLEVYLRGISEMPSSWPVEALKAQAVAARTYAYARLGSSGDFDVYDDTRSQVYSGYEKEAEAVYGVNWVNAVNGTAGVVATYGGSPISALYCSSSGGKTENSENVFSTAYPYLRGISDADSNSDSPNDNPGWTYSISRGALEAALGISGIREIQVGETGFSPRAKMMRIFKNDGSIISMSGTEFRSRLGSMNIKSTWFTSISSPGVAVYLPPVSGQAKRSDANGDGKADVIAFYDYGSATAGNWAFLSSAGTFSPLRLWISAPGYFDANRAKYAYGDFDGDGKEDAMAFYDYGGGTASAWMFKSNGTTAVPVLWWKSGVGNFDVNRSSFLSGDFNGDGRDEVLAFYDYGGGKTGAFLFSYTGSAFLPSQVWFSPYWDASKMSPIVADIDGSGFDKVVAFYDYGGGKTGAWLFNISPDFWAVPIWFSPYWDQTHAKPVAADLNGDGKEEIASFYDYGGAMMKIWYFTWNGLQLAGPADIFQTPYWDLSKSRLTAGDYDGDGKGEIAAFYNYGSGTSGIYLFKMGQSGLYAYPGWVSKAGYWDASKTALVKNAPEPKYLKPGSGFIRRYKLVALDAGHGGTDPGGIGNGLIEKAVNLDVMLRVRDMLLAKGYQVVTTRTTDTDVNATFADLNGNGYYDDYDELMARVNVANGNNADIYVSVHHNTSLNPADEGAMGLYGPQSSEGQLLASKIAAGVSAATGFSNRGAVPRGDLYQTTHTNMPGVISEGGFLTNYADALLLMGPDGRQREAQGIVSGINAYYASR